MFPYNTPRDLEPIRTPVLSLPSLKSYFIKQSPSHGKEIQPEHPALFLLTISSYAPSNAEVKQSRTTSALPSTLAAPSLTVTTCDTTTSPYLFPFKLASQSSILLGAFL